MRLRAFDWDAMVRDKAEGGAGGAVAEAEPAPAAEPAADPAPAEPKSELKAAEPTSEPAKQPEGGKAPEAKPAEDEPAAGKERADAPVIPDEWRTLAATGADGKVDPDLEKFLSESGSINDLVKRAYGLRKAQSKGPQKLEHPGDKATEEQLNAYYEAAGVPKDPADYITKLELPDFLNNDDGRAAVKAEFEPLAKLAQRKGVDADTFNEMAKIWFDGRAQESEQRSLADKEGPAFLERSMLERGYSKTDYNTGLAAIQEWGAQSFGEDKFEAILNMRTADGRKFGNTPEFFEAFAKPARDTFGETLSLMTGGAPSKEKADARYDELGKKFGKLSREGRISEWTQAEQEEMDQLSRLRQGQKKFKAA